MATLSYYQISSLKHKQIALLAQNNFPLFISLKIVFNVILYLDNKKTYLQIVHHKTIKLAEQQATNPLLEEHLRWYFEGLL